MKQFILMSVLSGLLLATVPLRAQVAQRDSDARKGSRLELGRTPTTSRIASKPVLSRRFSLVPNPATVGLDRSVHLQKNTPINEHYRTLLMTKPMTKSANGRSSASETGSIASADARPLAGSEIKAEDRLFANEKISVSNAYPNPADDAAEIDYQFTAPGDARLVMVNVLGAPVGEYNLEQGERKLRIGTRNLPTGYYLYQLSVDGRKVATKRLLVRHQ
ncbi:T9SS type A sorting domain-containing protein [Spirosoma sp. 209]|uniref:T9SS type A sorting domain-containing protein n=1 Tax=Spirosoma sp. 209 TaxID=1955701 RepID=UPI00098CFC96|nr:T9SS type A sorting domain-containing protein [Spirosoma sp. 209]